MNKRPELLALSPLDGRYLSKVSTLRGYFSESSLIKHRILIETIYLIELVRFLKLNIISKVQEKKLLKWQKSLNLQDFNKVKKIESEIKHDVKAVEYFIKKSLIKLKMPKLLPWVHWGLTSEDVNNLSYGLMIQKAKDKVFVPSQTKTIDILLKLALKWKKIIMPGRTHGQIAVPTTVGKELLVFASRACFFLSKIRYLKIGGKLNGAVGNFNAQAKIYPKENWVKFSHDLIKKLGLEPSHLTTQIEPYSQLVFLLDLMRQLNNIWLDLAKDCWLYIGFDYFVQKITSREVGSSTMPHKVNPIDFENAEGNLELANSLLIFLSNKLPISRLQRDLSDSTVKRNLGLGFGYSLLGLNSLNSGLLKITPNTNFLKKEIDKHPEMLSEALQLVLKNRGDDKAYEKIKAKIRGKSLSWQELTKDLDPELKKQLQSWKAKDYTGLAIKLVDKEAKKISKLINC